jgi:uncharacterized protein (TIGR03663 family)
LHGDEANQAVKTGVLMDTGVYHYDPHEHHGPTLYYLTLPIAWLSGARHFADTSEFTFRFVPVLFGVGLVLLLWPLGAGLGRPAAVVAAALLAISPAMVYYSRYYIQEAPLVFFTAAAIVSGWRYAQRPSWGWAVLTGLSVGLMHATKETCIIAYAALAGALLLTYGWARVRGDAAPTRDWIRPRFILVGALAAAAISVLFFSSFFTYAKGPLDSVMTFVTTYAGRATSDQGAADTAHFHDHPWYYYLALLLYFHNGLGPWFSEAPILLLGLIGVGVALKGKPGDGVASFLRFLAIYTLLVTAAYSVIPYKTPWCLLSFYHGIILMAGVGGAALWRWAKSLPRKIVVTAALVACAAHLGVQTYRVNFVYPANPLNPYVYAHTVPSFLDLAKRIEDIAALSPDGHHMLIKVIEPDGDYWPLPFYLRKFDRVGYWQNAPADVDAPVIVTSPKGTEVVEARTKQAYKSSYFGQRPDVLLKTYVRQDLWDAFIATR